MERALVRALAWALVRALVAPHSRSSERALAQGRAQGWVQAPAPGRQAQGPDRPGPALPVATAPRAEPWDRFGPRRRWARGGLQREMLGMLACFACVLAPGGEACPMLVALRARSNRHLKVPRRPLVIPVTGFCSSQSRDPRSKNPRSRNPRRVLTNSRAELRRAKPDFAHAPT